MNGALLRVNDQHLVDLVRCVRGSFCQLASSGETISTTSAAVGSHVPLAPGRCSPPSDGLPAKGKRGAP